MNATLKPPPKTRIRAPIGARKPPSSPPPMLCIRCEGDGIEPYEEAATIPCSECQGCGVMTRCEFLLPRTRSHELRRVVYTPKCCHRLRACGRLALQCAMKESHRPANYAYELTEFVCDAPTRGFCVEKVGAKDRVHHVEIGPDGLSCTCEGETYLTSAKHNQKAYEAGGETFPTYGCKHLDAVAALLNGGWFDV